MLRCTYLTLSERNMLSDKFDLDKQIESSEVNRQFRICLSAPKEKDLLE